METVLKVGDRVSFYAFDKPETGTVYSIFGKNQGTIRGDRLINGSGTVINESPYNGQRGWAFNGLVTYRIQLINDSKGVTMLQQLTDLSNLIQRSFSEQTKTLYCAGYLSKDLNITDKLTKAIGEMFVGHIIDNTITSCTIETLANELVARAKAEIDEAEKAESK